MTSTAGIILAISLMIIMFGLGLSLTSKDFKRIFLYPKAILIGLTSQIILLPIIAYVVATYFNVSPIIAVGIMLLAACPGGATSNLVTFLAKGDLALSISLTAFASMLSFITIPLILQFALNTFLNDNQVITLDTFSIIKQMFAIIIIPVSLGMIVNAKATKFARSMDKAVKIASTVIFVLVMVGLVYTLRAVFFDYLKQAGLPVMVLNIATMIIGLLLGLAFRLPKSQTVSISIESGIQNGTLAITIATLTLNNAEFAVVPAVYGLLMYITATIAVVLGRHFITKAKPTTSD